MPAWHQPCAPGRLQPAIHRGNKLKSVRGLRQRAGNHNRPAKFFDAPEFCDNPTLQRGQTPELNAIF
ncbi:MAG: hypothetical protein A2496_09115 [Burkholderiales bacterium RIFOXYC12_FULL_60_6]|nr:MAG: hypothetical protein A2503_15845 [Burkholderiales bacterium RIFOXYD12_FULL_59_19]OGB78519.1 MAG: hypothetical protein A2496_09115 [Burkholderiales bacterium RIFOXYC12_FULL_60_6]